MPKKHQTAIQRARRAKDAADLAFRDAIRAANAESGASVRELAKVAGVTPRTVQRILTEPTE
ncbi:hypothetical protein GCM10025773_11590 [Microbacterium jejuense]